MTREAGTENVLIVADSETDSNLYYATRLLVSDPVSYLELDGEKILLVSDLEYGRARQQAEVDQVVSTAPYEDQLVAAGEELRQVRILDLFLKERGVRELIVPASFPLGQAERLRDLGYELSCREEPFFAERALKTEDEVEAIRRAQQAAERCMEFVVDQIRRASIRAGGLHLDGRPLTAEWLRREARKLLLELEFLAGELIIAPGDQACDPHCRGSGPLAAGETIVIDIFPRSLETRYWGDITRTVVRGRASPEQKKLYADVLAAQEHAMGLLRAEVSGKEIHDSVVEFLASRGNPSGEEGGRKTGFMHGTGHGVGLDIHEPPRIGKIDGKLAAGHVVTVEPGLYYPGRGAVRLEDVLVVTAEGSRNLTAFPKELELC